MEYKFSNVAAGTYTLKVMKENHVTREYTVVVGNSSVIQDGMYPMTVATIPECPKAISS